jgi:hypothetical protein
MKFSMMRQENGDLLTQVTAYCESIIIRCHQFRDLYKNALIHGFFNSWFQTLHATNKVCISLDFQFSWIKGTTKSTKIRIPRVDLLKKEVQFK